MALIVSSWPLVELLTSVLDEKCFQLGDWRTLKLNKLKEGEGAHSTMDGVLALHPAAPGLILGVPKKFSSIDVAEIY